MGSHSLAAIVIAFVGRDVAVTCVVVTRFFNMAELLEVNRNGLASSL